MTPTNDCSGVTTTSFPLYDTSPLPVSTLAPTISSGVSGNGFESFARTGTVVGLPWCASSTVSWLARASGRVEATTVSVAAPSTGGCSPSVTVIGTCTTEPLGTSGVAWARSVVPSTVTVTPSAPPDAANVRASPSGSAAKRARSTVASSPAATSSVGVESSGATCSGGTTLMGIVSTAVLPSGSSRPAPSVTSNVTAAAATVRASPAGPVAKRARPAVASPPAATSSVGVESSGGRFSGGTTLMGIVSSAVLPSGSSGPDPSVTSNVTAAGPTYPASEV